MSADYNVKTGKLNKITLKPDIESGWWSPSEARFGDQVRLIINTKDIPDGTEVKLKIYEYDPAFNDRIDEILGKVNKNRVQVNVNLTQEYYTKGEEESVSVFIFDATISVSGHSITKEFFYNAHRLTVRPRQTVFLTFDDGPEIGTKEVIEVLRERKAKATFFMVGQHAKKNLRTQNLLKEVQTHPDFELANHSQTHAGGKYEDFYDDEKKVLADFRECEKTFSYILGAAEALPFKHSRLPGRNTWRVGGITETDGYSGSAGTIYDTSDDADLLQEKGYQIYGWDIEWKMKSNRPIQSSQEIFKEVRKITDDNDSQKKNKVIVLMHDRMFSKAAKRLRSFIILLQMHGYDIDVISKY